MRAAVYLRQSLDRTGEALAVARQRKDCLALCEQRGWTPVEYCDNDHSATNGKVRPEYQRMLADIRDGKIDALVAWDLDRLYRLPRELEDLIDLADEHRLALATVTGDVDLSTDNGRLYARIKGAVGKGETERKGPASVPPPNRRLRRVCRSGVRRLAIWQGRMGRNRTRRPRRWLSKRTPRSWPGRR